jgi:hypothetical protein
MGVRLKRMAIPDDLVPRRAGYGNGQGILRHVDGLSEFCERLDLIRLDHFIVDHCALVEQALEASGWVEPQPLEAEVMGEDPDDADYFVTRFDDHGRWRRFAVYSRTDADYLASQRQYARIVEEVERGKPWFDPTDGLRTVRGLMDLIQRGVPLEWREEPRGKRRRRLLETGVEPERVERLVPRPIGGYHGPIWDLRTIELELAYAERVRDLFHFVVSY